MAHLWIRDCSDQWAVMPLEGEAYSLLSSPPRPSREWLEDETTATRALLLRINNSGSIGGSNWALVAGQGVQVSVNGMPLNLGMRFLADRDEIRVSGIGAFFFSTESLARVENFTGAERAIYCPRCKQELAVNSLAVKCPQCGVWHHQMENLPCWLYAGQCALCDQPTELDGCYRWRPEEL